MFDLKDLGLEEFEGVVNMFPDVLLGREILDEAGAGVGGKECRCHTKEQTAERTCGQLSAVSPYHCHIAGLNALT